MPEVEVNGARLYYEEKGTGPETIVFSHGYLLSSHLFHYQLEALQDRYRCLAYDHRGHGRSEKTAAGYEMENLYADAVGFIEALGCAPCHFVGLSTGGFIGLRLAIRRPDLLKSLVLMETSAEAEPEAALRQYKLLIWVVRLFGWRLVIGRVMQLLFAPKFLTDPARQDEAADWKARLLASDRTAARKFGEGIFTRASVREELGQIKTPTLMMVGEKDVPTPVFRAERIVQGIPGARLVVIPEAGHTSPIEEPAAVTAALEEFLRAQV